MTEDTQRQILDTLRELRDDQRAIVRLLSEQRALAEDQVRKSRSTIEESVSLQRLALRRQRTVTLIAVPGILVCLAAIAYLVLRYF